MTYPALQSVRTLGKEKEGGRRGSDEGRREEEMRSREMGKGRWGEGKRIDSCFPVSQSSCTFRSSGSGVLQRLRSLSISCLARLIVPAETSPVRSSSTNMRAMAKQSWWLRIHFRGIFSTRKPMAMQLGDGKHVFVTTNPTSTVALKFHSLSRGEQTHPPFLANHALS